MSKCFLCLEKASRKICPTCKCCAHDKCWGEYLQNKVKTRTYFSEEKVIVISPWSVACPQCRGPILNVKPVTRSDTSLGRKIAIVLDYISFLEALDNNSEDKYELYIKLLKVMLENRSIVLDNKILCAKLKLRLSELYINEHWKPANLYHHRLFGIQIPL